MEAASFLGLIPCSVSDAWEEAAVLGLFLVSPGMELLPE